MEILIAGQNKKEKQRVVSMNKALDITANQFLTNSSGLTRKFSQFWDLMDVIEKHGYLRAAISAVGRGVVGSWWNISEHPQFRGKGDEAEQAKLYDFYSSRKRQWDNIKDYQNMAYKLMIAAMYLKFFGQAAFYIVRNKNGRPIGLNFLHGFVVPNVDSKGYFKSPAFYQYADSTATDVVTFNRNEVVYITNPDFRGDPVGGSDIESLSQFSLPTDIYLMTAAREYLKNRDKPEAVYELPPDITDEAFDEFAEIIAQRYRGAANVGRTPIVVAGELNIKELRKMPEDLPFSDSRNIARNEILATSGTNAIKLGVSDGDKADVQEFRKEFLESTLIPVFKMIEVAFYEQIHVREFGIRAWEFEFNHPDFLTAVEQATVHMRYIQMGVMSVNEARNEIGLSPREGGDEYVDPTATAIGNNQGSPPEGREERPDKPSNTGEPTDDDQDPPRGDQHDDPSRKRDISVNLDKQEAIDELYSWRDFVVKRIKKGLKLRPFIPNAIPLELGDEINEYVLIPNRQAEEIKTFFDIIIKALKE